MSSSWAMYREDFRRKVCDKHSRRSPRCSLPPSASPPFEQNIKQTYSGRRLPTKLLSLSSARPQRAVQRVMDGPPSGTTSVRCKLCVFFKRLRCLGSILMSTWSSPAITMKTYSRASSRYLCVASHRPRVPRLLRRFSAMAARRSSSLLTQQQKAFLAMLLYTLPHDSRPKLQCNDVKMPHWREKVLPSFLMLLGAKHHLGMVLTAQPQLSRFRLNGVFPKI